MPSQIQYSDKYFDDTFEYRYGGGPRAYGFEESVGPWSEEEM